MKGRVPDCTVDDKCPKCGGAESGPCNYDEDCVTCRWCGDDFLPPKRFTLHCPECNSPEIRCDAEAIFDAEQQKWKLHQVLADSFAPGHRCLICKARFTKAVRIGV